VRNGRKKPSKQRHSTLKLPPHGTSIDCVFPWLPIRNV